MSDLVDPGIAAAAGAFAGGAYSAVKEWLSGRRKRKSDPPPAPAAEPSSTSVRIGALVGRVDHLERDITAMRHETAKKLEDLAESVDELMTSNAAIAATVPLIQQQLRDLRDDLRDDRRRAPTHKE